MNAIAEKTRNVLATLSDIQPAVSVSGLEEESVKIQSMKRDLAAVLKEMTTDDDAVAAQGAGVVTSLHADMMSQAFELGSALLECDPTEMDDCDVQNIAITARCFAEKAENYLDSTVHLGGRDGK